ncbi:MAG: hypothetical protein AABW68_05470 [archaeon]
MTKLPILLLLFLLFSTLVMATVDWSGHSWNSSKANGIHAGFTSQNEFMVRGIATASFWNSFGKLSKPLDKRSAQVDIALADTPASATSAGIWFVKDSQNALIVEKHRDITDPHYHTNLFIVERVNGTDSFKYVSTDAPSSGYDTFKIQKILGGYQVYYNGALTYTGTLNLSQHTTLELVSVARAAGDTLQATFQNYVE